MKIYVISSNSGVRLVRAPNKVQALSFVASQELTVRAATQDDLVEYLGKGKVVETIPAVEKPEAK